MPNPTLYKHYRGKYSNFVDYCTDVGFSYPVLVADHIINNEETNNTYTPEKLYTEARIAWSIIKCGIYYKNSMFVYTDGKSTLLCDLSTMLNILLLGIGK